MFRDSLSDEICTTINFDIALTSVVQLVGASSCKLNDSNPGQGTCPGFQAQSQSGYACKGTD